MAIWHMVSAHPGYPTGLPGWMSRTPLEQAGFTDIRMETRIMKPVPALCLRSADTQRHASALISIT
jgi:hypothetical protein